MSVTPFRALDRPERLFEREERLEHEQVDAAVAERLRLFGVRLDADVGSQRSVWLDELASRTVEPATSRSSPTAARASSAARHVHLVVSVEASGPIREPRGRGAEAAREHEVRARLSEAAMQLAHVLRRIEGPSSGDNARLDPHVLVVRPRSPRPRARPGRSASRSRRTTASAPAVCARHGLLTPNHLGWTKGAVVNSQWKIPSVVKPSWSALSLRSSLWRCRWRRRVRARRRAGRR